MAFSYSPTGQNKKPCYILANDDTSMSVVSFLDCPDAFNLAFNLGIRVTKIYDLRPTAPLTPAYTTTLTTKPTSIPISPDPIRAIGPVYHSCCMHSTMRALDTTSAQSAGMLRVIPCVADVVRGVCAPEEDVLGDHDRAERREPVSDECCVYVCVA